jgi:nicotinamidase-related amidase
MPSSLLFWDVDTQFDFMYPAGKLYVPGAETIISNLHRPHLDDHRVAAGKAPNNS